MDNTERAHRQMHTLRSRMSVAINWFIPPETRHADPDTLRRARLVVAFAIALMSAGVFYTAALVGLGSPIAALAVGTGTAVVFSVLIVMRRTGSTLIAGNLQVAALFGVLTAVACRLGGHHSISLSWYAVVVVVALSTAGRRSAFVWGVITVLSLGTFYALDRGGYALPTDLAEPQDDLFRLLASLGLVAILLSLTYLYETRKDQALAQLGRAEEKLRRERDFAESLVETAHVIVLVLDTEGRIVRFNQHMEEICGYRLEEVRGRDWCATFIPQRDQARIRALFSQAARDVQTRGNVNPIVTRHGRECEIEWYDRTLKDGNGNVIGVLAVGQDITERLRAEQQRDLAMSRQQELNRLQQDLLGPSLLDEKLRRITDGVVSIFGVDFCRIWITRPGDRCESGCVHAKVTEGPHVCEQRDHCLWLMASSGRYAHIDGEVHRRVPFGCYKIGRVAAGAESKVLTNEVTIDPRVHNHEWARELELVSFAGYQLRPPGGDTLGVLALFSKRPISLDEDALLASLGNTVAQVLQKARAEAENEALNKELLDTSRRAGMAEVATGVLHNVGNVLNSVNVSAGLMVEQASKSKVGNLGKAVALLQDNAGRVGDFLTGDPRGQQLPAYLAKLAEHQQVEQDTLIRELQELTRNIEHICEIVSTQQSYAGTLGVVQSFTLEAVVEDALRMSGGDFERYGISVAREFAELPELTADRHKVLQVLVNLLSNARHALRDSDRADRKLTVRLSRPDDQTARIAVSDNGVGIPAEHMSRLFTHGFTTKPEGHGFGLHHSALLIQQMGGSLSAHSDGVGEGATFVLELPIEPTEAKA